MQKLQIKYEKDKDRFRVTGGGVEWVNIYVRAGYVQYELPCRYFLYGGEMWILEKDFRDGFNNVLDELGNGACYPEHLTSSFLKKCEGCERKTINRSGSYDKTATSQKILKDNLFPIGNYVAISYYSLTLAVGKFGGISSIGLEEFQEKEDCKKSEIVGNITDFVNDQLKDDELIELFNGYLEVREKKRLPTTDMVVKLLIKNLRELSNGNVVTACEIVTQGILKGWKNFYPVKRY